MCLLCVSVLEDQINFNQRIFNKNLLDSKFEKALCECCNGRCDSQSWAVRVKSTKNWHAH